jgi:hypothetical protein
VDKQPTQEEDEIAGDVIKAYERARADRGVWEDHWEEIARRILPHYVSTFQGAEGTHNGQRHTEMMIDATGALALPKFAAAMESMLTPRSSTWHKLQPIDKLLLRNKAASVWYDDVNAALFRHRYAPRANFASQQHEIYMGLGAFGTGAMYVDQLDKRYGGGLRYRAIHLGEIYFLENHQGLIDTALRRFQRTARQAYQKWGDNCPEQIIEAAKEPSKQEDKFWFIHSVQPRNDDDFDQRRLDHKGTPIVSYYVSETGRRLMVEGGYRVFPYQISRYIVAPGEIYGRSPAMMVLPSLKTLNEMKRTVLKAGHRALDPVLLAHDDGVLNDITMRAGDVNWGGVTADGKPLIHALPVGNIQIAKEMLEDERSIINDGFLVTLFQILIDTPQMTATEVLERAREKGALLSPTMGRQQSEALGPMIERELDVLAAQNLLPPMPAIVAQAKGEYHAVYESPLNRSQRAEEASGLMRVMDWMKEYIAVTQDPSPADWIDWDSAMPDLSYIAGVRNAWIKSPEQVAQVRQDRAKQQQQKQMVDAAPAMSAVAKALPQIKSSGMMAGGATGQQ